jgi:adenylate cyclase
MRAPDGEDDAVLGWLLTAPHEHDAQAFVDELAARLNAAGLALTRVYTFVITADPEVFVRNLLWTRGQGVNAESVPHGVIDDPGFQKSPLYTLYDGAPELRRRLDDDAGREYPALAWLRGTGATDYLGLRLPFAGRQLGIITFATDRDGGFSDPQLELLRTLKPALSLRLELLSALSIQRSILEVYLGMHAADDVRAGDVRRGRGRVMSAAILWTDLRGFTALSDQRPLAETVALLDRYFERVVAAVGAHGGDVLKLIGDAVLAIFPCTPSSPTPASARALAAALDAQQAMATLRAEARALGEPELHMGVALTLGDVLFGNVGGRRRLDFTVIGPPVNEASRVEGLCKPLERGVLATAAFARAAGLEEFEALGPQRLEGVAEAVAIFAAKLR